MHHGGVRFTSQCDYGAPPDLPDAGEGACCLGSAVHGPQRCTCWEPVFDLDQAPITGGPATPMPRTSMCGDCAYRPRSPERQGDETYANEESDLETMVQTGAPFACHQGMRRPVVWRHPSGAEVPGHPANYQPPMANGWAYKADGSPADICGGWLLRRARFLRENPPS
jgi:hypothetical protein